jgi:thiol-disulfide isomerase/thioredoxin
MFKIHPLGWLIVLAVLVVACSSRSGYFVPVIATASSMPDYGAQSASSVLESTVTPQALVTAPPTSEQVDLLKNLKRQGAAPELTNQVWLNSPPLKLADLRGKVVIIDFWTFDCINCIHVTPALKEWYSKYKDKGLVIIGVHSPEFDYERDVNSVKDAIARMGITYPVAIDNDFRTWQAFRNQYWPAFYFVDKAGQIRHVHIGEGDYEQSERIIRALLAESAG